jgi:hypothetical protein
VTGAITEHVSHVLSATFLRALAPATMNLDLRLVDAVTWSARAKAPRQRDDILELPL